MTRFPVDEMIAARSREATVVSLLPRRDGTLVAFHRRRSLLWCPVCTWARSKAGTFARVRTGDELEWVRCRFCIARGIDR